MSWPPFHPGAQREFDEAFDLLAEKSPVLARRFVKSTMTTIDLLRDYPEIGPPIGRDTRKFHIRPFAYDLIYLPAHEDILVVAVAHHRRRPEYWRGRI